MRAIQITAFGGPESMKLVELPDPVAGPGFELIDVSAIGINYADTHQTENSYLSPQKLPLVPGIEVVGTTSSGRRVLTPVASGGYAQKALAYSGAMIDIPEGVSDSQALCMLVQGSTAWHILKTVGHVKAGESVVIHAAAGGVGTIAIQLAKMWGAKVIAVVSTQEKRDLTKSLGADSAIDADQENLGAAILEANNGKPVDLVLEMVGGKTFDVSLEVLAPFGRLITFGMASRTPPTAIHPGSLLRGSKTITGFWLSHCFGSKELLNDVIIQLFELVKSGKLKPVIGATFPLSQATRAHQAMLGRETTGKITLNPNE
ncbi:MAG: zinc-binding dehydrogenase [Actinomycetota bacterium]|nr:zinc-binding dehydrogenase [Actinomycetota bacterium]